MHVTPAWGCSNFVLSFWDHWRRAVRNTSEQLMAQCQLLTTWALSTLIVSPFELLPSKLSSVLQAGKLTNHRVHLTTFHLRGCSVESREDSMCVSTVQMLQLYHSGVEVHHCGLSALWVEVSLGAVSGHAEFFHHRQTPRSSPHFSAGTPHTANNVSFRCWRSIHALLNSLKAFDLEQKCKSRGQWVWTRDVPNSKDDRQHA